MPADETGSFGGGSFFAGFARQFLSILEMLLWNVLGKSLNAFINNKLTLDTDSFDYTVDIKNNKSNC